MYCTAYCTKLGFLQFLRSHILWQNAATLEREFSRVVDKDSLNLDPDPAFQVRILIRIRIQGFDDQKLKKTKSWNFFFFFFWTNIAIKLSPGRHKGRPSYRRSLKPSKEKILHFKKWNFVNIFLLLWVIFALLDPNPRCESVYGSKDPIESGSNSDPDLNSDPQYWKLVPVPETLYPLPVSIALIKTESLLCVIMQDWPSVGTSFAGVWRCGPGACARSTSCGRRRTRSGTGSPPG